MDWKLLFIGLGLALFIEGVAYAVAPEGFKKLLVAASQQPAAKLRGMGLTLAVIGVGIVWLVQANF
ncbi:MAG: DUF2065 domain-containing protein [Alphaproteobacteria bacterium]|nr:DUF2065 domain-containing protein [Alphaproteobacteria bacterium]